MSLRRFPVYEVLSPIWVCCCYYYNLGTGSCYVAQAGLSHTLPATASQLAVATGVHHHAWLLGWAGNHAQPPLWPQPVEQSIPMTRPTCPVFIYLFI